MFTISVHGSRAGVIKQIQAAKAEGKDTPQDQVEAAKAFLISEINLVPKEFNGVEVSATGSFHPGSRQFQATIIPKKLAL